MIVNCAAYADGRRIADLDIDSIPKALEEVAQLLVGLHEPDEEVLRRVQKRSAHDLAIEDAHRAHHGRRSRIRRPALRRAAHAHLGAEKIESARRTSSSTALHRHGAPSILASYASCGRAARPSRSSCGSGPRSCSTRDGLIVDNYFPIVDRFEQARAGRAAHLPERGQPPHHAADLLLQARDHDGQARRGAAGQSCNQLLRFARHHARGNPSVFPRRLRPRAAHQRIDRRPARAPDHRLEANLSLIAVNQNEEMRKLAVAAIIAVPTMVAASTG